MFRETHTRTIFKTLTWRITATCATITLVYSFTGRMEIAAIVGGLEIVVKLLLYYLHERTWDRIKKGKYSVEPFVIWFTGLPCSGKTTLADRTYRFLKKQGVKVERLDGEKIRELFPKTGYSLKERAMHIRRVGHLASLIEKNGVCVIASFISPQESSRVFVKSLCNRFIEISLECDVETCRARDTRNLYARAENGELENFTGVSSPYEKPDNPDLILDTSNNDVEQNIRLIREYLFNNKYL